MAELYDRMELKNLVDTFSVLADQKNTEAQKWLIKHRTSHFTWRTQQEYK